MAEGRGEVRARKAQKLLPDVEAIAMLGGKAAGRRDTLYISQQHTARGQRKQIVELKQTECRQPKCNP